MLKVIEVGLENNLDSVSGQGGQYLQVFAKSRKQLNITHL